MFSIVLIYNAASRLSFLGSIRKHSSVRLAEIPIQPHLQSMYSTTSFAIMICPRCCKLRATRKDWRDSQWYASSPTVYPYDGCRQCHDSGPSQQRLQDLITIRALLAHDIADFQESQADKSPAGFPVTVIDGENVAPGERRISE